MMNFELGLNSIGEADVLILEKKLGVTLPVDYREFLLQHNGGRPTEFLMNGPFGKLAINDLYGIGKEEGRVGDIATTFEFFDGRIPKGFISIGDNAGGDKVLLGTDEAGVNGVFFFDHENEPANPNIPWEEFPNLYKLADSFNDFLEALQPDD